MFLKYIFILYFLLINIREYNWMIYVKNENVMVYKKYFYYFLNLLDYIFYIYFYYNKYFNKNLKYLL